jgi:hypothetical protein
LSRRYFYPNYLKSEGFEQKNPTVHIHSIEFWEKSCGIFFSELQRRVHSRLLDFDELPSTRYGPELVEGSRVAAGFLDPLCFSSGTL